MTAGRKSLAEMKTQRGMFQGDVLSPLLFHVIQPHTQEIQTYEIAGKDQSSNIHDDIKLFVKKEKELETVIQAVRIYSLNMGKEFGIEKCAKQTIKSGKLRNEWNYRIKKKNQNAQRKGNLQILGNIESGHHQTRGTERKTFKKSKKSVSGERKNYSKPNYIAGTS